MYEFISWNYLHLWTLPWNYPKVIPFKKWAYFKNPAHKTESRSQSIFKNELGLNHWQTHLNLHETWAANIPNRGCYDPDVRATMTLKCVPHCFKTWIPTTKWVEFLQMNSPNPLKQRAYKHSASTQTNRQNFLEQTVLAIGSECVRRQPRQWGELGWV